MPEVVEELGLMYSHTCNIACRHCGIESGPKNRNRMDFDFAVDVIRQAARLRPPIRTLVFTGGEPLVHRREIEALVEIAADEGLSTRIVTNGFWARDLKRGRRLLHRLRLAGLNELTFSADKFHLEFQPAAVLRNALDLAFELRLGVSVTFVHSDPEEDALDAFARLYDLPRERLARQEDYDPEIAAAALALGEPPRIWVTAGRLVAMGRAAEHPGEHLLSPLTDFGYGACHAVANKPVVYPDGTLQACCCAGGKLSTFHAGNLRRQDLASACAAMTERSHYRFINRFGPRRLYEVMTAARGSDPHESHASICDVCVRATQGVAPAVVDGVLDAWALDRLVRPACAASPKPVP